MKLPFLVAIAAPVLFSAPLAPRPQQAPSSQLETKGACSPIAPNNHGSINIKCDGFTAKKIDVIQKLLSKLTSDQVKDQDVLLAKLEEILEADRQIQKIVTPRVIPNEIIGMLGRSPWATCAPTHVTFRTRRYDMEAQKLADQISEVMVHRGEIDTDITSGDLVRKDDDPDIRMVGNEASYCVVSLLYQLGNAGLSVKADPPSDQGRPEGLAPGRKGDLIIYVYPKGLNP